MQVEDLFIYIDGPKLQPLTPRGIGEIKEEMLCLSKATRCHLTIRNTNLGLVESITTGVTEVLSSFSRAVIIEDDIKLSPLAFSNFNRGLDLIKNSEFMTVGGFSYLHSEKYNPQIRSSKYFSAWGWAIHADKWKLYEKNLSNLCVERELKNSKIWKSLSDHQQKKWIHRFSRVQKDPSFTWDIQMQFACFRYNLKNLLTTFRWVDNEGFGDEKGTNTVQRRPKVLGRPGVSMLPLKETQLSSVLNNIMEFGDTLSISGDSRLISNYNKVRSVIK
jgi:hypothetical protein